MSRNDKLTPEAVLGISKKKWHEKNNRRIDLIVKKVDSPPLTADEENELKLLDEEITRSVAHLYTPLDLPPHIRKLLDQMQT